MTTLETLTRLNSDLGRSPSTMIPAAEWLVRLAMDLEAIRNRMPRAAHAVALMIPERVA